MILLAFDNMLVGQHRGHFAHVRWTSLCYLYDERGERERLPRQPKKEKTLAERNAAEPGIGHTELG